MDPNLRLVEGCMLHSDGTRTISCFCSDRDDCNMAWQGEYLRGEGYELPDDSAANASATSVDMPRHCQVASVLAAAALALL